MRVKCPPLEGGEKALEAVPLHLPTPLPPLPLLLLLLAALTPLLFAALNLLLLFEVGVLGEVRRAG